MTDRSRSAGDIGQRRADTSVPINPLLAARWSPRAFDASAELSPEQITPLLEAARWAATWGDRQPVRLVVGVRGDETFTIVGELLKRGNSYAKSAGALILVCIDEGRTRRPHGTQRSTRGPRSPS